MRIEEGSLTRGKSPDLRADAEGPSLCPHPCSTLLLSPLESRLATHTSGLHSFLASSIRYVCRDKPDWLLISCLLVAVPSLASLPSNPFLCPSLRHQSPLTCSGRKYFGLACGDSLSFHLTFPHDSSSLCCVHYVLVKDLIVKATVSECVMEGDQHVWRLEGKNKLPLIIH